LRAAFVNRLLAEAQKRDDLFILSGDAGLGLFDEFQRDYPARFINLGIAEQNAASMAAGLALAGFRVYLYNIIPFVLYRCYEQVRNDICYQELSVTLVGIGSGVTYAPQGMTHYAVEDLALAGTLPNLTVFSPADPLEAVATADLSLAHNGPVYVRLAKNGEPPLQQQVDASLAPMIVRQGRHTAILFHGSIAVEALHAWETLRALKIAPRLISVPGIQPLDEATLIAAVGDCTQVMVVEEHYSRTGLGGRVIDMSYRWGLAWQVQCLGVPQRFIHEIRDTAGMRCEFGINAAALVTRVKEMTGG
jgi:transketolase